MEAKSERLKKFGRASRGSVSVLVFQEQNHQGAASNTYFLSVLSSTQKEQLCTNTSDTVGWKRKPPPYVDHLDITVNFSSHHVAPASLFAPLSLFMPDAIVQYDHLDPHIHEDRRLVLLANFPEDPNVLEHLKLDDWKKVFPYLDRLKRARLLGGLGMRHMKISRCLHWKLRQSVEAYLGFVFQSIVSGTYRVKALTLRYALLAIGIEVQAGGDGCVQLTNIDHHEDKGFKLSRLAITDRWGMYREFDIDGNHLHARPCRKMRTNTGCPRALQFDGCGCACPYLHARSSELGKWLVASARNETSKQPTPWDRLLAHKDDDGLCYCLVSRT